MKKENIENRINQLIKQITNLEEVQANLIFLKCHTTSAEARIAYNLLDANFIMQKQLLEELLTAYKIIEKELNNKIQQN